MWVWRLASEDVALMVKQLFGLFANALKNAGCEVRSLFRRDSRRETCVCVAGLVCSTGYASAGRSGIAANYDGLLSVDAAGGTCEVD